MTLPGTVRYTCLRTRYMSLLDPNPVRICSDQWFLSFASLHGQRSMCNACCQGRSNLGSVSHRVHCMSHKLLLSNRDHTGNSHICSKMRDLHILHSRRRMVLYINPIRNEDGRSHPMYHNQHHYIPPCRLKLFRSYMLWRHKICSLQNLDHDIHCI